MKKMNKKLIKILTILMIVLMTVCCGTVAFAAEDFHVDPITPDNKTPFGIFPPSFIYFSISIIIPRFLSNINNLAINTFY